MMMVQPLRDDVFVEIEEAPESQIILKGHYNQENNDVPVRGRVLAVGPGRRLKSGARVLPAVRVGDRIQFYMGGVDLLGDRRYGIVQGHRIQAVLAE